MEILTFVRSLESKQIPLLEAFQEDLIIKFEPNEWYWDKRAWVVQLVNLMFDQKAIPQFQIVGGNYQQHPDSEPFGIKGGRQITDLLKINKQKQAHPYSRYNGYKVSMTETITLEKLVQECEIHKWGKYALYEILLRYCHYDDIQRTVLTMIADYHTQQLAQSQEAQFTAPEDLLEKVEDISLEQ